MGMRSRVGPRVPAIVVVLVLAGLLTGVVVPAPARASCAGPSVTVTTADAESLGVVPEYSGTDPTTAPARVEAGARLAVTGANFLTDCYDTISCTGGCGGCTGYGTAPPMLDLRLVLTSGDAETELGRQDADVESGAVHWNVALPTTAAPGPATLEVRWQDVAVVEVPLRVER